MTFDKFRTDTLKIGRKGAYKINSSYGIKDIYRRCIKNKLFDKSITEKQFRIIINTINQHFQDRLLQGYDVTLPEQLGKLEIRKFKTYVAFEDNKVKSNLAIDWDSTLRLWYEDNEAKDNKTLVRHETPERFKIIYNKSKAVYNNKIFYTFDLARVIRIKLKNIIKDRGFDALLFDKRNGLCKHKHNS